MSILLRNSGYVLKEKRYVNDRPVLNEVMYTPSTWAEWSKTSGITVDAKGAEITSNGVDAFGVIFVSALKPSTKYGIILYIASNNTVGGLRIPSTQVFANGITFDTVIGYSKGTDTTLSTISVNQIFVKMANSSEISGKKIKFRDIRIFELPPGSQIEADFASLTADQLNVKYPYAGYALIDHSRYANNGTFSNVSWVKLPSGLWVKNFNNDNSYISIPDNPALRLINGGTLMAWIKPFSLGEGVAGRIFHKGEATSANGYYFLINGTNELAFKVNSGTALACTSNAIILGRWQFVAVTFNSVGRHLYANAVDVTTTGGTVNELPPDVAGAIYLGNASTPVRTFDGYISGERISTKVLTQAEILRIFMAERSLYGV